MVLSIIALVLTLAVAWLLMVQGVHRAAQALAACVLAGALAFGFYAPLSEAVFSTGTPATVRDAGRWYFAGDAVALWAIYCAAFMAFRTLAGKFLKNDPNFPPYADRAGGFVLGAVTGYFSVGICLVLVQMLPTSPDLLGYEAFRYVPARGDVKEEKVEAGTPLWLGWDRDTLAFFGYLSGNALGSEETSVYRRCGDVYPPKMMRREGYQGVADADDFLYYHWYRRWEFILWQTGRAQGPVPEASAAIQGPGLALAKWQSGAQFDINIRIINIQRAAVLDAFPQERAGSGQEFLFLTVRFQPEARPPLLIDTSQFYLLTSIGDRVRSPLVLGRAKAAGTQNEIVSETDRPAPSAPRNVRFSIAQGQNQGAYLADGVTWRFTEAAQWERVTLVFTIPKGQDLELLHLAVLPKPPPSAQIIEPKAPEKAPEAKPPEPKPGPKAPETKPGTKPPETKAAGANAKEMLEEARQLFAAGKFDAVLKQVKAIDRAQLTPAQRGASDDLAKKAQKAIEDASKPPPAPTPTQEPMFTIEKAETSETPVSSHGFTVTPGPGTALVICTVRMTDRGKAISKEEFEKLRIAQQTKEFSVIYGGKLAASGDFELRLTDKTLVPARCLPVTADQPGPVTTFVKSNGQGDWLVYVNYVRVIAFTPKGATPEALIWGDKYEAAVPAPPKQ